MTTETITLGERRILFAALTRARRYCAVALPADTAPSTVQSFAAAGFVGARHTVTAPR
jgi:hypothetical protein